ncbi:hypothetical protein C5688_13545 [Methylocystis sp. MitZ-2018]|nr:hypothetical protein C5688_13545 [Methylocystis sp. MitZ-2018]
MSYISSDFSLVAQIGVAIITAFYWFAATCFFSGVVIGLLQVISYVRTPRHLRASRFPEIHE